jgi:TetR/AcrR family transcriptional regulator
MQTEANMPMADDAGAKPTESRKRQPGARRLQILQTLATMLEDPRGEKVTTAALAAKLAVSEAALYRHFASKAQMFEGLIEFIESTIFGLINDIGQRETSGLKQVRSIVVMLLEFAQTNKGMTRVLIGDALVNENERLQERMNQFVDRIEASLRQSFRVAVTGAELPSTFDATARASLVVAYVLGRWHRFAKSGFRKAPAESIEAQLPALLV